MSIGSESPGKIPVADSGDPASPAIAPIDRNALDVLWNDFRAALSELTIFGKSADPAHLSIGRTALFYPAVGLVIGVGVSVLDWVLRNFLTQEITSVLLVGALALLSAGRQLDGFANTADGLIGFRGREWAIATIRDRRLGSSGAAAIAFLLILKVRCLDLLSDPMRVVGVLLAPMIGRAAIVLLAYGARAAGSADGDPDRFDAAIGLRELVGAGAFAAVVTLALGGALGLLVILASGLVTLALRFYFDRRLAGVAPQSLDAGAEIVETLALIMFALAS
jgi:adenosylcobinamide-GDP ribazoletransferase